MAAPPLSLKDTILAEFAKADKAAGSVPAGTPGNPGDQGNTDDKGGTGDEGDTGDAGDKDQGDKSGTDNKGDKSDKSDKSDKDEKDEKDEDEYLEIDASPEEIQNALNIVRALSNKETAAQTMEELAQVTGYKLETKQEVKKFAKDVKSVLREKLGDAYDLLSGDKLAEAFDALLEDRVGAITKPVLERIEQSERAANEQKANAAMDALWARHNITDKTQREKLSGRMMEKMKNLPAGPGTDVTSYLDDIFSLVTRDTEKARTVAKTVTKIKKNAQDVSRTSGDGGSGADEKRVKIGSRLPTLKESIAAAVRNERFEQ